MSLQVLLILLCTSFQGLATGGFGLVLPSLQADLGLTFTEAGSLAAAATLVYAAMQIPSGVLADRFGPRRLFAIGTLGTNALLILLAVSGGYVAAVGVQALSGLARSLAFAPGLLLMRAWFPGDRQATAMGLFVAGGAIWTVLFGLVAPVALAASDWRTVLAVAGFVGLAFALLFARVGGDGRPAPRSAAASTIRPRDLVREPVMWLVAIIQATRLGVVLGVGLWLPTFLVDEHDLPLVLAGAVVAVIGLATAPSNLAGGLLADRWERPYAVIGGSLIALAFALVLLGTWDAVPGLVVAVLLIAACQQLYFGPLFAAPVAILGAGSVGLVSGTGNLFANLGGFAAVLALGAIRDATGSLAGGFIVLAGCCIGAVVATWALAGIADRRRSAIAPPSAGTVPRGVDG